MNKLGFLKFGGGGGKKMADSGVGWVSVAPFQNTIPVPNME